MGKKALSRWQQFYLDDSSLVDIPPSNCAHQAAEVFSESNSQIILLDLGCSTGRDSLLLASSGAKVVGVDAARSGFLLAQKRYETSQFWISWVESDSRLLPFLDAVFDGVYCFGLLHEFVGQFAEVDLSMMMDEIYRVLKTSGVAILATVAGDPEKGLPHVQNFSEAMFDVAISGFQCIEKKIYEDFGCTGRTDYKV